MGPGRRGPLTRDGGPCSAGLCGQVLSQHSAPAWVGGKGSAGARMGLAGGATGADLGNRELGGVQYADSEAAADPGQTWVPTRGPRSTGNTRPEDTDCVSAQIPGEP